MITVERARLLALASEAASNASVGKEADLAGYTKLDTSDLNGKALGSGLAIMHIM